MTSSRSPGNVRSVAAMATAALFSIVVVGGGCATPGQTVGLVVASTVLGGQAPSNEIEQIYYLGIFDPQEQLPPQIYRLTVHGQASAISLTRFASGWVPANMVDTLNTSLQFNKETGALDVEQKDKDAKGLETGRRLVMFGPEGFREAPKDHRLVIVMGSNPEWFFKAVGDGLATVSQVQVAQQGDAARSLMLEELLRLQREQTTLKDIQTSAATAKSAGKGE